MQKVTWFAIVYGEFQLLKVRNVCVSDSCKCDCRKKKNYDASPKSILIFFSTKQVAGKPIITSSIVENFNILILNLNHHSNS